jgi:hypothetical protein
MSPTFVRLTNEGDDDELHMWFAWGSQVLHT